MLENCKSAKERWGGVNEIIDRWLQERQDMLVLYCQLSQAERFDEKDEEQVLRLRKLCQIMVDYVSAGHFEVYDQLIKEAQEFEDKAALTEAASLFETIDQTTEVILDINDKYLEQDDLSSLSDDLSNLGPVLEQRFESEDRMIEVLHVSHTDLVS